MPSARLIDGGTVAQAGGVVTALAAEDRAILALEGPHVVGHTCKVVRLGAGAPSVSALRESVAHRLGTAPRLTWRLAGSPEAPMRQADEALDIAVHIVEARPGALLDDAEVRAEVSGPFPQHLDRRRPLWRIDVVRSREGGTTLVWRLHHALADGTTAMRLAGDVLWDATGGPATTGTRATATPVDRSDDARRIGHLAGMLEREFLPSWRRSPFDSTVAAARDIAFATVPLSALHISARSLAAATLNDAVLAVMGGALCR